MWKARIGLFMNCLTHFEIYGDEPSGLANFYGKVFGWEVEQIPGIAYWRINTGSAEAERLNGGLSSRREPERP
jgi:predicted enzyme related to lactoylglutathione lyase